MTIRHITLFIIILLSAIATPVATAFSTDHYPRESVLASGRWVKVSVDADGLYSISASTLRSWGFSDLTKVRVYGLGGARINDALVPANAPGDLPMLQSALNANNDLVFYATGPGRWIESSSTPGCFTFDTNVFTARAYYFITETDAESRDIPSAPTGAEPSGNETRATTFMQRLHHELENFSPAEAGPLLLGEDFRYTRKHNFEFNLPAPSVASGDLWFQCSFVAKYLSSGHSLNFTVNGEAVSPLRSDNLNTTSASSYAYGAETVTAHSLEMSAEPISNIRISIELSGSDIPALAALNYLTVNYERSTTLPSDGYLVFGSANRCAQLNIGNGQNVTIWDVTDPANIMQINTTDSDGNIKTWNNVRLGHHNYAAWSSNAQIPTPRIEGIVANQNLHGADSPDMVIICPPAFTAQAQRLADFHTTERNPLTVYVVSDQDIYNEFGSGQADPGAIRNYLKMLYDRGVEGQGKPLRYTLLMGRMTVENRNILSSYGTYPTIPAWCPWSVRSSLSDNEGFFTDDYYAMLEDGAGTAMDTDKLLIAVGRMPVTDEFEARNAVDKEIEYGLGGRHTGWKQRMMFLADDGDHGEHLRQSEEQISFFENTPKLPYLVRKVYMEAYTREGGIYPEARAAMFRNLDEGVVWWNYIGHASTTGWTGDGQLSYNDLNQLYLRHLPFIYAATCDFLRLDALSVSGAEIIYKERYGGCIGVISATRPVYIAENRLLSNALGRALALRDEDGRLLTPGEMYRRAKNDIQSVSSAQVIADDNRLRYVFVGDPALRLAVPDNIVQITSIGGQSVDGKNEFPVIAALSRTEITGTITNPGGTPISDFNGIVTIDIFDAERTLTSKPADIEEQENFEDIGERVFSGSTEVVNGQFTITAAIPAELAQNWRPGAITCFAYNEISGDEAAGFFRDFYLFGFDDSEPADTEAPVIESMVLNHNTFENGTTVNEAPMLIATVRDNVGINISTAGIGHQLTAILDGTKTFTDLATFYTPSADGTPSGTINYPLEDISEGSHTLALRVWDTSGNSAIQEVEFNVQPGIAPKIYDIYSDANPASTIANFYLSHDQPDAMVTVEVTVYNMLGSPVWSGKSSGRSDMFLSVPVSWDLSNNAGNRVNRGIYLYRARITADGKTFETATHRIAVTAQ